MKKILILLALLFSIMCVNTAEAQNNTILSDLNLSECRITQDEDSHIKKGNWSMYAYDIACIRWHSFNIYVPNNRNIYLLEKIWYDKRLWNFIIIKNAGLRWIYWHTITTRKEWESLKPWELLWQTDVSWISQNYHLHIELWAYRQNIRFSYLQWEKPVFNDKSFKIRMQRWVVSGKEINEKILDFIIQFEWLEFKAYWDIKHWSIWAWTPSYKWEEINEYEARKRARIRIQSIREKYKLDKYNLNIQKAVVSFVYNIWSLTNKQIWLLENWFYKALWNDFKQYNWIYIDWKKKILAWLLKRRVWEYLLLTN